MVTSGRHPTLHVSFRKVCPVYAATLVKLQFLLQTPWRVLTCNKHKKVLFSFGYIELRGTFRGTAEAWLHVCSHVHRWWWMILDTTLSLRGRQASVRAVHREVIMLLLRPSERKGDRPGRADADAAAERPDYWPPLHFWRSRSSSESRDNDDSSVLTGMRSLLKPQRKSRFNVGAWGYCAHAQFIWSWWHEVISESDVLNSDPGIKP